MYSIPRHPIRNAIDYIVLTKQFDPTFQDIRSSLLNPQEKTSFDHRYLPQFIIFPS